MRNNRGFTLFELLIVIAVAGIAAGLAIPSFNTQIRNNSSVAVTNEFSDSLGYARSEAIKRSSRVSVCASRNGTACDGEWKEGYIVFVDTATSDTAAAALVGTVLKYWQPPKGAIEFKVEFGGTTTNFFRYTAAGTLARVSTNPLTASIKLTGCQGNYARNISINTSGQVSTSPTSC